jgi:hypothetical protein
VHHGAERLGQSRGIRLVVEDAVHQRGRRHVGVTEGVVTGGGEHGEHAPGEDVGRRSDALTAHLFGGEPGRLPDHHARARHRRGIEGRRDPEVDDLDAARRDQHVGGLQVAVHDVGRVDGDERLGHAGENADGRG